MDLPEDIVFQILSRLPAKSLMKFKCVSRSWYALLQNQTFISEHTKNMAFQSRLLLSCRNKMTNKRIISMSADSLLEEFPYQDLPPSFSHNFGPVRLIGPCNGIICLYGYPDHIVLGNPSIREFKILPKSQIPRPLDGKVRGSDVGLGFDAESNDYKVIQTLFCISKQKGLEGQVEIYSLRTNSWKKYDSRTVPDAIMHTNLCSTVHKNGTFCWWALRDDDVEVILSFDMTKEAFQETPLPSEIEVLGGKRRSTRAIMPWNDSIAIVVYHIKETRKVFETWVVNELGSEMSWTKLSTVGPISDVERPLGFWKNGELILENFHRELVLFDVETKRIRHLGIYAKRDRLEALVYYESLVSLENVRAS